MALAFIQKWGPLIVLAVALNYGGRKFRRVGRQSEEVPGVCGLMDEREFAIHSKRIVTAVGVMPAVVVVRDGRIAEIMEQIEISDWTGPPMLDFGDAVVMPGLVDIHVHLNEPGREDWEGFITGTRAAAAGGVTTLVDMPLNSWPTTTTSEYLNLKLEASKGKLMVDVGFWGGLVPDNADNSTALEDLLKAGALGLKSFMCPSGINDFEPTNPSHFRAALPVLAKYGVPLLVHAEVPLDDAESADEKDPRKYETYHNTRPATWELEAIRQLLQVAKETRVGECCEGARLHIVHLSNAQALSDIQEARDGGSAVSVETNPHYLNFAAEDVADGQTYLKCAPPLRSQPNRDLLWAALKDGKIDLLSSDHSPAPPDMKREDDGNFIAAWGGISSLQLDLPATWTPGRAHGISLSQLALWWSTRPAQLANLPHKGAIEVGRDGDFVVWDPEASFVVADNYHIYHKHKRSAYDGMELFGRVLATFVRGQQVYNGSFPAQPCGTPLLKGM
eukprot:TRINITY_DN14392_c0_g1_i1.p1 TRINITY_DN14392_c0_g1~~TRINITY_DN14392_c0_g1_i1.p1  ORF type:complete len:504 (-),score=98.78 TRINITY_DN14392_c0_g1_i1:289-1800(-)